MTAPPGPRVRPFRLRPRTLRLRLTLLYAAVFCGGAAVLGAAAVIFKPGFLVHSAYQPAGGASHTVGRSWDGSLGSFLAGLTAHHNLAGGAAMLAIVAALAAGAGWLIAGRVVRPLRAITASARAISASNLRQRLDPGARGGELADLGDTLNDLFERLEASFESQRRFVANASHELRTPLSAGRALLQVALTDPDATADSLRAACQDVLALGDQQERLIAALLTLATSERGIERWASFDLAGIAQRVVLDRHDSARRRGIRVESATSAALAEGDAALAECLLANLVDNAVRHNHDGGWVEVSTAATGEGAVVTVANTGPLVSPGEVDRLFEPFQRSGAPRVGHDSGHGLGLAIVRAIASAHSAELATAARPGGGLAITVSFPRRGARAPLERPDGEQPAAV